MTKYNYTDRIHYFISFMDCLVEYIPTSATGRCIPGISLSLARYRGTGSV